MEVQAIHQKTIKTKFNHLINLINSFSFNPILIHQYLLINFCDFLLLETFAKLKNLFNLIQNFNKLINNNINLHYTIFYYLQFNVMYDFICFID
jgi:hypothetical protein